MLPECRIAVVGCGKIVARHIDAISNTPGCRLVAVADISPEKAEAVAKPLVVPWYPGHLEMLKETDCDAICILTPSGLHADLALQLMQFGKHLIIEKPLTLRLEDTNRLLREAKYRGIQVFVVHQYRFHPAVQHLHAALQANRFGKIILATTRIRWCRPSKYYREAAWRGTWAMDGGVIANQACHHVDLLQWLIGPVASVKAWGSRMLSDIEAEDLAVVVIQFENGAMGIIEATTCARPRDIECSLSVLGEHGTVEIGGPATNQVKCWAFSDPQPEDEQIVGQCGSEEAAGAKMGHRGFYKAMALSLQSGTPFLIDGHEARKSVELISAIYESMETGRDIQLRFKPKYSPLGLSDRSSLPVTQTHT